MDDMIGGRENSHKNDGRKDRTMVGHPRKQMGQGNHMASLPIEEKAMLFHQFLIDHQPDVQYSAEEIFNLFREGVIDTHGLCDLWGRCCAHHNSKHRNNSRKSSSESAEDVRVSASAPELCGDNSQTYPGTRAESRQTEGVSHLDRGDFVVREELDPVFMEMEAAPMNWGDISLPDFVFLPPPEKPKPPTQHKATPRITWVKENVGRFFINKVYFDASRSSYWRPAKVSASRTEILSFDEVAQMENLTSAILVTDVDFTKPIADGFINLFPSTVKITLVAPADLTTGIRDKQPAKLAVCLSCYKEGFGFQESRNTEQESCRSCRFITLVPHVSRHNPTLKVNMMLMRYTTHLRIIIFTGSLTNFHWEKISNAGWLHDFPLKSDHSGYSTRLNCFNELLEDGLGVTFKQSELKFHDYEYNLSDTLYFISTIQGGTCTANYQGIGKHISASRHTFRDVKGRATQKVIQVRRLGHGNATSNLTSQIFTSNTKSHQLIYPSESYIENCAHALADVHTESLTQAQIYENFNTSGDILSDLHNLVDTNGILSSTNMYTEYVDIAPDDPVTGGSPGRLGWILLGSQTLGYGSWGNSGNYGKQFARTELGVGLYPRRNEDKQTRFAIDLTEFMFPCHTSQAYRSEDVPYNSPSPNSHVRTNHVHDTGDTQSPTGGLTYETFMKSECAFIGEMGDVPRTGTSGFIDELFLSHPLSKFGAPFPRGKQTRHRASFYLPLQTLQRSGIREYPPASSVILFTGETGNRRHGRNPEVYKVLKVFTRSAEAATFLSPGLGEKAGAEDSNARLAGGVSVPNAPASLKESPAPISEEEMERCWQNKFSSKVLDMMSKDIPSQKEVEGIAMNPIKMTSDMTFLEKHVTTMCHGKENIPNPLRGPLSLSLLIKEISESREQTMKLQ